MFSGDNWQDRKAWAIRERLADGLSAEIPTARPQRANRPIDHVVLPYGSGAIE